MAQNGRRQSRRSLFRRRAGEVGSPPGTLVHIGDRPAQDTRLSVIAYDADSVDERPEASADECMRLRDTGRVVWLDVDGFNDVAVFERIGECYGIHPMALEDILNTGHRPKVEDFGDHLCIVLKMIGWDQEHGRASYEHMSLILGSGFVISFQERIGDILDPVRERLRTGAGRMRQRGADYLAYCIIDCIVDHYFVVLEKMGDRIELLEEAMATQPTPEALQTLHGIRSDALALRKAVWPLREVISLLQRGLQEHFTDETQSFLRDVYEHVIEAIETLEAYRELLTGMFDTYLSLMSNRTNEVMRVLTIIATIFIPITFVAGVYGMNFENMPELGKPWGYPAFWGVSLTIAGGMLVYFRRKRWL